MKSVFLEINGKPVPFFISLSEYSGGDILKLKFEGYESYEKVKRIHRMQSVSYYNQWRNPVSRKIREYSGVQSISSEQEPDWTL